MRLRETESHCTGDEKKLDEKERQLKRLSDNPYVSKAEEKWSEIKITMSERFYGGCISAFSTGDK